MATTEQPLSLEQAEADRESLERIIERQGLDVVCEMLEGICYDRAEHLAFDWQDRQSGKNWIRAAKLFGPLPAKLRE